MGQVGDEAFVWIRRGCQIPLILVRPLQVLAMAHLNREFALRAHIRNLLLDYALTHLTTDYLKFTEDAVYQVWFRHTVPHHYF
jgi:hypothetical protein